MNHFNCFELVGGLNLSITTNFFCWGFNLSLVRELISQIFDFLLHKEAFPQIFPKSAIFELLQNRLQFLQMVSFRLVVT